MTDHALPSITLMPHIRDDSDGWYVIIADVAVAGPFTEEQASRELQRILDA